MTPRRLAIALLDLVIPSTCAACGMPGAPLCDGCMWSLPVTDRPWCGRCGHPWSSAVSACPECPPGVAMVRHAMPYDPAAARIMRALKDSRRRALAVPLARVMAARIDPPDASAVLVPIPQSPARRRERGFNQAALLAAHLGVEWSLPVRHALVRCDDARHQRGASRGDRMGQVQGAFRTVGRPPHHAVLVDDVLTTGATLSAAARVLRAAGCARVGAVVTARVVLAGGATRVG